MFSKFPQTNISSIILSNPTSDVKQKVSLYSSKPVTVEFQYFIKIAYLTMVNQEYVNIVPPTPICSTTQ